MPNLAKFDYLDVIKNSTIPSMIIKGEKDRNINKAVESTIIEFEIIGDFKLYEMNGAGHFSNLDNSTILMKF